MKLDISRPHLAVLVSASMTPSKYNEAFQVWAAREGEIVTIGGDGRLRSGRGGEQHRDTGGPADG